MQRTKSWVLGLAALASFGAVVSPAQASLIGQTINYTIGFSSSPQTGGNLPLSGSFLVGSGVEISGQAVSYSFLSSGFTQTLSGAVNVDVSASDIFVSFTGTAQAGGLFFDFSGITDSITNMSVTGQTGKVNGVNDFLTPVNDSHSVSGMGFFLFGFQPGTSMTQTVSLQFATQPPPTNSAPEPGSLALAGLSLGLFAVFGRRRRTR